MSPIIQDFTINWTYLEHWRLGGHVSHRICVTPRLKRCTSRLGSSSLHIPYSLAWRSIHGGIRVFGLGRASPPSSSTALPTKPPLHAPIYQTQKSPTSLTKILGVSFISLFIHHRDKSKSPSPFVHPHRAFLYMLGLFL